LGDSSGEQMLLDLAGRSARKLRDDVSDLAAARIVKSVPPLFLSTRRIHAGYRNGTIASSLSLINKMQKLTKALQ
jgi:hypothetical protein